MIRNGRVPEGAVVGVVSAGRRAMPCRLTVATAQHKTAAPTASSVRRRIPQSPAERAAQSHPLRLTIAVKGGQGRKGEDQRGPGGGIGCKLVLREGVLAALWWTYNADHFLLGAC